MQPSACRRSARRLVALQQSQSDKSSAIRHVLVCRVARMYFVVVTDEHLVSIQLPDRRKFAVKSPLKLPLGGLDGIIGRQLGQKIARDLPINDFPEPAPEHPEVVIGV